MKNELIFNAFTKIYFDKINTNKLVNDQLCLCGLVMITENNNNAYSIL